MKKLKHNYFESNRASKFIYGIILMLVFVLSQSHTSDFSAFKLALLAIFAAASFAFAEIYSESLGNRIKTKGTASKSERIEIVDDSMAMLSTGVVICFVFLFSAFGLYGLSTAFTIAYAVLLSLLFSFSYWAYKLSGFSHNSSVAIACLSVTTGLLAVWLKYIFGH